MKLPQLFQNGISAGLSKNLKTLGYMILSQDGGHDVVCHQIVLVAYTVVAVDHGIYLSIVTKVHRFVIFCVHYVKFSNSGVSKFSGDCESYSSCA